MAKMNMTVSHKLTEAEALKRIQKLLGETKKQYGDMVTNLKESWEGNVGTFSFKARGYELSGSITVLPKKILLEGDIPWTLSFLKGKIEKMITDRAKALLS